MTESTVSLPQVEQRQLPYRDSIVWTDGYKTIEAITDPIAKSALMQMWYEDVQCSKLLPGLGARIVPIAVLARDLGYTLAPGQDIKLGQWASKNLESQGKIPHGRYEVNTYIDNDVTREALHAFFR